MYTLTVLEGFAAAHRLPVSGGRCERLHGHNWKVEVTVQSEDLNEFGMVIDFQDLKALIWEVLKALDHSFLNEHPFFMEQQPTAENLARYIYQTLSSGLAFPSVTLTCVRVWESESTAAAYMETS